jgi:hypothetical protein
MFVEGTLPGKPPLRQFHVVGLPVQEVLGLSPN